MFLKSVLTTVVFAAVCSTAQLVYAACDVPTLKKQITSRFVLKGNEVLDKQTQLVWQRCSVGTKWNGKQCAGTPNLLTLVEAKQAAKQLGKGWRIPNIEELHSIVEPLCTEPIINNQVFIDIQELGEGAPYWSDTPIEMMPHLFYYIDFMYGDIDGHTKNFSLAARLVKNHTAQ